MKVHIVNSDNIRGYGTQIGIMHAQRKHFFVDKFGWSEIDTGTDIEFDQFDHEDAIYLLLCGDVGEVLGSCRLTRSTVENVTFDLLGGFFDEPKERKESVWEVSRWLPSVSDESQRIYQSQLMLISLFEFGLKYKIKQFVACVDQRVVSSFATVGHLVSEMSTPKEYAQGIAVMLTFDVSYENLKQVRLAFNIFHDVLVEVRQDRTLNAQLSNLHFSIIDTALSISNPLVLEEVLNYISAIDLLPNAESSAGGLLDQSIN